MKYPLAKLTQHMKYPSAKQTHQDDNWARIPVPARQVPSDLKQNY